MFLSLHFLIFCFEISALVFFYLGALLECCLSVLAESGGCRIILLLLYLIFISKNPKIFAYHHALHFPFLHCTCTRFALEYWLGLHIGKFAFIIWRKLCISCSSIPGFHGHNAFALIVRCAFYFMLRHNTISCTVISLFWVIKPIKINAKLKWITLFSFLGCTNKLRF